MKKTFAFMLGLGLLVAGLMVLNEKKNDLQLSPLQSRRETGRVDSLEKPEKIALNKNQKAKEKISIPLENKITALEEEIEKLEEEFQSLDVEMELNSPETSQERRAEIIGKANAYALKMGELARLEAQAMAMEETK